MVFLKPWQEIKINDRIAYFQFYARYNGKDFVIVSFDKKDKNKNYYKYEAFDIGEVSYL